MNEQQRDWYRKGLGPRIDAIELALQGLAQKREDALPALRRLARTLWLSSQAYGFPAIARAAQAVEDSSPADSRPLGGELIAVLRREVAGHAPHVASVLIVSGDGGMAGDLAAALEARGKTVARVATAAEAAQVLASRKIVFIAADMFLPDADGRQFIAALRSRPLTASIPVVALSAKLGEDADVRDLVPAVDGCFLKPVAPDQVAEFIALRMKRARETLRDARRDLLTGLLNRAAFYEQMELARSKPQARGEPSVVVLLKVDRLAALAEEHGAAVQEPLLRHVGALLSASFRAMDVVARWGAEEFAVLFPGEDLFGGLRAVEKIMALVTRRPYVAPNNAIVPFTLSAGLAAVSEAASCDEIMERAAQQLYQAESAGGNRMASSESEAVRRKDRILIAVRDDTLAGVIKELIEQNHVQADVTAASAAEVRPLLAARRFHLVILDGDLPGDEGFALLGEARTLAATARVPLIVLVSSEADMVRALEGGANDYIVKPFQPMALLASVRRVLSRGIFSAVTTVLVVDDDLPELILVGTALHKAGGFKVLMQRSGQGALRRMLELHPQAVIWRWNLPELGGGELLKTLSNTVGFEKLGVLFLADARQTGMIPVSDDPRVKGVVTYPVDVLNLAARVRTLLKVAAPGPEVPRADEAHWQREIQGLFQSPKAAKVA